jgi:SNF2 family DNA or RNA helicase
LDTLNPVSLNASPVSSPIPSPSATVDVPTNLACTDTDTFNADTQNDTSNNGETTVSADRLQASRNWDEAEIIVDTVDGTPKNIPNEIDLTTSHVFDKSKEYDKWLDEPNPWHPDLHRRLFPSQVIGFRWMCDRHLQGGGLVADVVGCGKVQLTFTFYRAPLTRRHTKQQISFSGSET